MLQTCLVVVQKVKNDLWRSVPVSVYTFAYLLLWHPRKAKVQNLAKSKFILDIGQKLMTKS